MMLPFDIFRVDSDGVRWLTSTATVEEAKAHISQTDRGASEYLLLNQITGNKIVLKIDTTSAIPPDRGI